MDKRTLDTFKIWYNTAQIMKNTLTFGVVFAGFILSMLFASYFLFEARKAESSVTWGNDYYSFVASSTKTGTSTLRSLSGSLGSVVISSSSVPVGFVRFYDVGATTAATTTLREIANIAPGADEGTYVFDIAVGRGLLVEVPVAFSGNYTITYR